MNNRIDGSLGLRCALVAGIFLLALPLAGCGGDKGTSGAKLADGAKASRSALKGKKPADAQKVTTAPKAMPAAKTAGSQTVRAPDPFAGDSDGDETFSFSADDDIDLDGDGDAEIGEVLYDEENEVLLVWWSDTEDLAGDGSEVGYSALVWIGEEEVGFIIEVDSGEVLACTDGAQSGCVVCDAEGQCTAEGLDGGLGGEEEVEGEQPEE